METKAYKKDFSSIGIRMLISAILITGIQVGSQLIVLAIKPEWVNNIDIILAVTMIPLYAVGYPLSFVIMKAGGDKRTIEKRSMKLSHFILAFMIGYGLLIVGNLIGIGVTMGIGYFKGAPVENTLMTVVGQGNIWISAIYIVLLAPIFEELLFRKLICDRVVKYGQGAAIIMSGLMFGLFHMNFNQFFYAFLIGCFFAFIYVKTGNLKYTIGLHMIVNFVGSVLGGLLMQNVDAEQVSGMIIYAVYALCVYGIAIAGIALLFINLSKIKADAGEITIEKGSRFKTMIGNVGMILYCLVMVIAMIEQAL